MEIIGKYGRVITMVDDIEETAVNQLYKIASSHIGDDSIRIMPDVHAGKGCVVGYTQKLMKNVSPNIIGVDIGCGMLAVKIKADINEIELDKNIRKYVPTGTSVHNNIGINFEKEFNWNLLNDVVNKFTLNYNNLFNTDFKSPKIDYKYFENLCKKVDTDLNRTIRSIGTLGGGNHFIEFGRDENDFIWFIIHTGSRNLGKMICQYHVNIAKNYIEFLKKDLNKENIEKIRKNFKSNEIETEIKKLKVFDYDTKDLEFITGENAYDYYVDMLIAVEYSKLNRKEIKKSILKSLGNNCVVLDEIETIHNYIDLNDFIIRKGSIRSYVNERIIIPFNMRDGVLICEGKSNTDWNCSAPHGAGRILSRSKAKAAINLQDFEDTMKGIYSTSVCNSTLDESPFAYKDKDFIIEAIKPTATVLHTIKPIINIKDKNS